MTKAELVASNEKLSAENEKLKAELGEKKQYIKFALEILEKAK